MRTLKYLHLDELVDTRVRRSLEIEAVPRVHRLVRDRLSKKRIEAGKHGVVPLVVRGLHQRPTRCFAAL